MEHAKLSPSASERWLACPGSLLPSLQVEDVGSVYADEGVTAHKWLERMFNNEDISELLIEDAGMYNHVREAFEYVVTTLNGELPRSEQRVDIFTVNGESCFGTIDAWGVAEDTLHVFDFKYGQGVRVDANNNSQLMLYAIGVLRLLDSTKKSKVGDVVCHIVQPRMNNFTMFGYTYGFLRDWLQDIVIPTATLAIKGNGAVVAGEHCRFCRLKGRCAATSFINELENDYKSLAAYEELSIEDKIRAARKAKTMSKWLENVESQLLDDVINERVVDERIRLVTVKGRTKIVDEVKAAKILTDAGITNHSKSKLLPYGQLKKHAELLKDVIETPVNYKLEIVECD